MTTKKDQVEKFKKVARELGVDEDEAAFDATLKRITRPERSAKKDESKQDGGTVNDNRSR